MNNIIATTVQFDGVQMRTSFALILTFLLLALISCHVKYKTILKMRSMNTFIILLALAPLLIIATAVGDKKLALLIILLIGICALVIMLMRTDMDSAKIDFMYAAIAIFGTISAYWTWALVMFG